MEAITNPEIISIVLGSSALTSIITFLLHRRTTKITAEIQKEFEEYANKHASDLEWKRESTKVLGQVYIHLNRTIKAMERTYGKLNSYDSSFENQVMFSSNKHIRD